MSRLYASIAAIALLSSAAYAADLPLPDVPITEPAPIAGYNWTGFYIGAHGGFAFDGENDWDGTAVNNELDGFFAGGTVGANWQINSIVLGVEGDGSWSDIDGSDPCPNPAFTCSTDIDWIASARGRLGFALDRFLVFGTGGAAFGGIDVEANPQAGGGNSDEVYVGWTAGGGVELGLWNNFSVKGEYAFYDFGDESATFSGVPLSFNPEIHTAKFGINYRFGGLGP